MMSPMFLVFFFLYSPMLFHHVQPVILSVFYLFSCVSPQFQHYTTTDSMQQTHYTTTDRKQYPQCTAHSTRNTQQTQVSLASQRRRGRRIARLVFRSPLPPPLALCVCVCPVIFRVFRASAQMVTPEKGRRQEKLW